MPPRLCAAARRRGSQAGFTLLEIVVSLALLGLLATAVFGGLLFGLKEGRRTQLRAAGAAWVQQELDYLRLQGYAFLADDVVAGTRTLTQTTGYTTYGSLSEPRIPTGFDRAVIRAEDVPGLALRKLNVVLHETPTSQPYTILSTYVANFTYAVAP